MSSWSTLKTEEADITTMSNFLRNQKPIQLKYSTDDEDGIGFLFVEYNTSTATGRVTVECQDRNGACFMDFGLRKTLERHQVHYPKGELLIELNRLIKGAKEANFHGVPLKERLNMKDKPAPKPPKLMIPDVPTKKLEKVPSEGKAPEGPTTETLAMLFLAAVAILALGITIGYNL